jgi:ubiquinone/menaquinone biosynthesis C-methylase UbiE
VLRLLHLDSNDHLLDVGCGQGVLSRRIPKSVKYTGVDAAPSLIASAKQYDKSQIHTYYVADVTKPLPIEPQIFSHVAIVLALQNIEFPDQVLESLRPFVTRGTVVVVILNHPSFRIPRQSSWGVDEQNKMQYRKVNRYMTPQKIPITMHPGSTSSALTWSFHQPLSYYVTMFTSRNFMLSAMEEWVSDKESVGGAARMENRARNEFPLFLAMKFICR